MKVRFTKPIEVEAVEWTGQKDENDEPFVLLADGTKIFLPSESVCENPCWVTVGDVPPVEGCWHPEVFRRVFQPVLGGGEQ